MNTKSHVTRLCALILLAAPLAPAARAQDPYTTDPRAESITGKPAWTPAPGLLSKLGPAQKFGPCTVRFPKGYTVHLTPDPTHTPGVAEYHILGPKRADGTAPELILVLLPGSADVPREDMYFFLKSSLTHLAPYQRNSAPIEEGTLGGHLSVRQFYTYHPDPKAARTLRAFRYCAGSTPTDVTFTAQDAPSHADATLPLLQAAVLTLHITP